MSYKVESAEEKWSIIQFEASKSSIKDLSNDLLDETKSFECQINSRILFKKDKVTETEFTPVNFNSTAKKLINHKFDLDKPFQEILYRIFNWINEKFGWIIESMVSQYINISTFQPLIGSSYIKVLAEIRSSK